jgi:hypothetical protein
MAQRAVAARERGSDLIRFVSWRGAEIVRLAGPRETSSVWGLIHGVI